MWNRIHTLVPQQIRSAERMSQRMLLGELVRVHRDTELELLQSRCVVETRDSRERLLVGSLTGVCIVAPSPTPIRIWYPTIEAFRVSSLTVYSNPAATAANKGGPTMNGLT